MLANVFNVYKCLQMSTNVSVHKMSANVSVYKMYVSNCLLKKLGQNIMHLSEVGEVHNYVISEKEKGILIIKTLEQMGIPRCTYYKMIAMNKNETWREISKGKVLPKKQIPKMKPKLKPKPKTNLGMSGGSLQPAVKEYSDFMKQVTFDLEKDREMEEKIRALDIHE